MYFKQLTIRSQKLEEQQHFYHQLLGFPILTANEREVSFQAGKSVLCLQKSDTSAYYHFAFNIPYAQIAEAYSWLKERVQLLNDGDQEVIDFSNWKAKAIYFFDADHNIVEFIGRSTHVAEAVYPFSAAAITEISEIGMPVQNVQAVQSQMKWVFGLDIYGMDSKNFCAMGSKEALFIIVDRANKLWYPTDIPALPFVWELEVWEGLLTRRLRFDGDALHEC